MDFRYGAIASSCFVLGSMDEQVILGMLYASLEERKLRYAIGDLRHQMQDIMLVNEYLAHNAKPESPLAAGFEYSGLAEGLKHVLAIASEFLPDEQTILHGLAQITNGKNTRVVSHKPGNSLDALSGEIVEISMKTSPNGSVDIKFGSPYRHVRSEQGPLVQIVFSARSLCDILEHVKATAPKSVVDLYESGRVSTKSKPHSINTGSACNITHCVDKNIVVMKVEEQGHSVDLANVLLHFGGILVNAVNHIPDMTSDMLRNMILHEAEAEDTLNELLATFQQQGTAGEVSACKVPPNHFSLPKSLKECMQYCAIYPSRHVFQRDLLVRSWISEGFAAEREILSSAKHFDALIDLYTRKKKYNSCRGRYVGMLRDALKGAYPASHKNRTSSVVSEAAPFQFSVETSPKGGVDIKIGSYQIRVPKYCSVHLPIVQMVLFARKLYDDTLQCVKSITPPTSIYELGRISEKPKPQSTNTGSVCKDVHDLTDAELENHCITPCVDTNILVTELEERDHRVDLTHQPPLTGDITANGVNHIPNLTRFILHLEEREHSVDLANVLLHFGGITANDVNHLPDLISVPDGADPGSIKAEGKIAAGSTWLIDTGAVHHATGNLALLSGVTTINDDLFITARDGVRMRVHARGSVITDTVVLPDVWHIPELTKNVISASQLTELDYSVAFIRGTCRIMSATNGTVIGEGHVSEDGLYEMDFLEVGHVI